MSLRPGAFAVLCACLLAAQPRQEDLAFFETKVRPVLKNNCVPCHNVRSKTSGLTLDSREGLVEGGNRGAAFSASAPADSLLLTAVEHRGDLKMPPGGRLKDEQIAALKQWIVKGAAWPKEQTARHPAWNHWSFQPVKRPETGPGHPIDFFVRARLETAGLSLSPEADRYTLLRRVSLDLTGLPPSPQEIQAFVGDKSPDAYEKVVDRLLASPHYGERWGRHWLDLARYADSDGYTIDAPRQIWKYRDWVINALNQDMGFDQFVIEQIGGDLLSNATLDQIIATGFHRNTASNFEGGIDFEQYRVEAVADRVATTGSVFLGLTLGCARCHDHKYDPISQKEFYQLFAFLNSVDEISSEDERSDFNRPILEIPAPEESARRSAWRSQFGALSRELVEYVRSLAARKDPEAYKDPGLRERLTNYRELRRKQPKVTTTLVMRELPLPRESYIHLGGDFLRKGVAVKPAAPAVLPQLPPDRTSRLDLAGWLVDKRNPLTARVTVNRFWQQYFGKGIVETENDFGVMGSKPTHPELLDWLASEFMSRNWSQKAIHRLIVTSGAYRQSSKLHPEAASKDPDNKLLSRQARLRLEAEIIRDSALEASGLLAGKIGGPSVYPPIPDGATAVTQVKYPWPTATGPDRYRRGMYTFFQRSAAHPALVLFDAPDATAACTRRVRSNNALQALTLLNDEMYVEFAQALAARVLKEGGAGDAGRIDYGYMLALGHPPKPPDRERLSSFLAAQLDRFRTRPAEAATTLRNPPAGADLPQLAAYTALSRVLLNLDGFVTRD